MWWPLSGQAMWTGFQGVNGPNELLMTPIKLACCITPGWVDLTNPGPHNFPDFWLICLIWHHINPDTFLDFNPPLSVKQPYICMAPCIWPYSVHCFASFPCFNQIVKTICTQTITLQPLYVSTGSIIKPLRPSNQPSLIRQISLDIAVSCGYDT